MESDTVSKGRGIMIRQGLLNILSGCKSFKKWYTAVHFACLGKSYIHQRLMQGQFVTWG